MQTLTKEAASVYLAGEIAAEILSKREDVLTALSSIAGLCIEAEYPRELMPIYMLDDEVYKGESTYGRKLEDVRSEVRDELILLVRKTGR